MASLDWSQCPAVESIPGKVSGAWVFKGTRTPVARPRSSIARPNRARLRRSPGAALPRPGRPQRAPARFLPARDGAPTGGYRSAYITSLTCRAESPHSSEE